MNAVLFDVALTAYIVAAIAAVGSFVGRREQLTRFTLLLTQAGWICHTAAILARGAELHRLPILTLAEVVSVVIWAAVLFELWIERHYDIRVLGAFVLPVVLALGLALPTGLRSLAFEPQGLPSLEALDRLTLATLTVAFPFLTVGLALGMVSAGRAWGSRLLVDPLALFSIVMWLVYAAMLSGRALGHWRGRSAAYFAIAGFFALLLTLGAGVLFQGRHGS